MSAVAGSCGFFLTCGPYYAKERPTIVHAKIEFQVNSVSMVQFEVGNLVAPHTYTWTRMGQHTSNGKSKRLVKFDERLLGTQAIRISLCSSSAGCGTGCGEDGSENNFLVKFTLDDVDFTSDVAGLVDHSPCAADSTAGCSAGSACCTTDGGDPTMTSGAVTSNMPWGSYIIVGPVQNPFPAEP